MQLEIVSPEARLFSGEVSSLILPGSSGSFQVLDHHAPIVSTLIEGTVKIAGRLEVVAAVQDKFRNEGDWTLFDITSGAIEMRDNKVILLTD